MKRTAEDHYFLADQYAKNGEFLKAISHYTTAIYLKSDFAWAYFQRGVIYRQLDKKDKAVSDFEKAEKLGLDEANAYYSLGYSLGHHYFKKHDYQRAIETFSEGIELHPNFGPLFGWRGIVYALNKEYELALEDFTRDIKLNPESAYTYLNRSEVYFLMENYDDAFNDAKAALPFSEELKYREILVEALENFNSDNVEKAKNKLKEYFEKSNSV